MANFCSKCGGKINPDDKFCKSCGATLIGSVEIPKEELRPEKPPAPIQIPTKPSRPSWTSTISNILGILIGIGIVFLVLYSLGCGMGMFPDTQDQMCQSIRQTFRGGGTTYGAPCTTSDGETGLYGTDGSCYTCSEGTAVKNPTGNCSGGIAGVYCCGAGTTGGGSQVSIGCQHCSPGYCWTGTVCCPRSAPYDCNGYCYRSSGEAYSAGCHQSTWKYWCCQ